MISKTPVGGMIWMTMQYLIGLRRLGFDPYYVEAHGGNPSMLMTDDDDDASLRAAILINGVMSRFGMERQWAFHALHSDGRCYGMSRQELRNLYSSAELILNLHGATIPSAEQAAVGRLIYIGTDPGGIEVGLAAGIKSAVDLPE